MEKITSLYIVVEPSSQQILAPACLLPRIAAHILPLPRASQHAVGVDACQEAIRREELYGPCRKTASLSEQLSWRRKLRNAHAQEALAVPTARAQAQR